MIITVVCALIGVYVSERVSSADLVINHFSLSEREARLYSWINELEKRSIFRNETQFDGWMGEFKSRYSEKDMIAMKLNFMNDIYPLEK